jgi:hypothetical protein
MPPREEDSTKYWCVCQLYCHGLQRQLHSRSAWYWHLQKAPTEDEKNAIRAACLSDRFRASVALPAGPSSSNQLNDDSDDLDHPEPPQKRMRDDAEVYLILIV